LTTVPFLHKSSTLKADDSLSKTDRVPWIGTHVIITKVGDPFKGYMGVVKDVLRGQNTASGLKIALQLEHVEFSSPFKRIVVDYDSVVEKMSVKDLHLQDSESILNYAFFKDHAKPRSVLFQPSEAYMRRSACRPIGQAPMPGISTSGGATPMPDQTCSSTPAWDPTSRTPR
jgi:transcription elongation factor